MRVTGGGVAANTFLSLYMGDDEIVDGDLGMAFGGEGDLWGAGVPNGNISPLGDFATSSPEYRFVIEIGNVVWSDNGEDGAWTTLATSASATYASLGDYIREIGDMGLPQGAVWTSTHFDVVPEPTGSLLVLLGAALLTLRRRRAAVC
ncbi:MAG: PEP-CTERM sorting domain-containing protein [Kiritimatiellae bacterium]|nr:PEP-CTERM sorting domain-containing protein [Kiritimatiellia bacterium]